MSTSSSFETILSVIAGSTALDDVEESKVLLPPSAAAAFHGDSGVSLVEITNETTGMKCICGVLDFSADEGKVCLPERMLQVLLLMEGSTVRITRPASNPAAPGSSRSNTPGTPPAHDHHEPDPAQRDLLELKALVDKLVVRDKDSTGRSQSAGKSGAAATLSSIGAGLHSISEMISPELAQLTLSSSGCSRPDYLVKYGRSMLRTDELFLINKGALFKTQAKRHFFLLTDVLLIAALIQAEGKYLLEHIIELPTCKVHSGNYTFGGTSTLDGQAGGKDADLAKLSFDIIWPGGTVTVVVRSAEDKEIWLLNLFLAICENVDTEDRVLGWRHQYMLGTMHAAVLSRDLSKVTELIAACSTAADFDAIEDVDEDGYTPLHYAVILRLHNMAQLLHDASANVTVKDKLGLTPVHWAALHLDDATLGLLSTHLLSADLADHKGHTPLFLACVEGRGADGRTDGAALKRCVATLVGLRADVTVRCRETGHTLLHFLAASWLYEPLQVLLSEGPNVHEASSTLTFTALHFACSGRPLRRAVGLANRILNRLNSHDSKYTEEQLSRPEEPHHLGGVFALKALLEAGARPNRRDGLGRSPLQLVAEASELWGSHLSDAVGTLVSYGARLDDSVLCGDNLTVRQRCPDVNFDEAAAEWARDALVSAEALGFQSNSLLVETEEAPRTQDACQLCQAPFSLFKRQHHCRMCNILCCDDCSKKRVTVEGSTQRCCDSCFNILARKEQQRREEHLKAQTERSKTDALQKKIAHHMQKKEGGRGNGGGADQHADKKKELFNKAVVKEDKPGKTPAASNNLSATMASMNELKDAMVERGEKLDRVNEKSDQMKNAASDFAKLAKQLNQKSNSWF